MEQRTTPHQAAIAKLQQNGIHYAEMTVLERDWIDTAERPCVVRVYADGRVTVDGSDIRLPDLRNYWVERCHAHHTVTGDTARLVKAPAPTDGAFRIGRIEAHALHVTLGQLGLRNHSAFAQGILGRPVPHYRDLTHAEARSIREAALLIGDGIAA